MTKHISRKGPKIATLFGVDVNITQMDQLLKLIQSRINAELKTTLFTPNAEILLEAETNANFKEILRAGDLLVPDSVSLAWAYRYTQLTGLKLKRAIRATLELLVRPRFLLSEFPVIKGRELMVSLVEKAAREEWKVFLMGGEGNVHEKACKQLSTKYPKLSIQSTQGPMVRTSNGRPDTEVDKKAEKDAIDKINTFGPDILFVAFGAPKQEYWIEKNKDNVNATVLMGVGGSLDYIAGKASLPPTWLGTRFEWLWRLLREPKIRIKRVFSASVKFPIETIKNI